MADIIAIDIFVVVVPFRIHYSFQKERNAIFKMTVLGTSLAIQWLRFCVSTEGGMGSVPRWGARILLATQGKAKRIHTRREHPANHKHNESLCCISEATVML